MAQTKSRRKTMSKARTFKANFKTDIELTDALNKRDDLEVDQDWENETTTWTFEDGSKLIGSGPFTEVED
jgi:hypothetical protein